MYQPLAVLKETEEQFVSAFEAHSFPFYGFTVRMDLTQFAFSQHDKIDHSPAARNLAQLVANHIVDEARMSKHVFLNEPKLTNQLDLAVLEDENEFYEIYLF